MVRTFADIDQSTPAYQRAVRAVNPWLAQALATEGLPPERVFGGSIRVDRPWAIGDPEHERLVDPPNPRHPEVTRRLSEAGVPTDAAGYPVNPRGDTGIAEGRRDNGLYATLGGRRDPGDRNIGETIGREVEEETGGLILDFQTAPVSYRGLAVDDRDTNQSWWVTECRRIHLPDGSDPPVRDGDDLTDVGFQVITPELLEGLHAIHGQQIMFSVLDLLAEQPQLAAALHPELAVKLGITQPTGAQPTPEAKPEARPRIGPHETVRRGKPAGQNRKRTR